MNDFSLGFQPAAEVVGADEVGEVRFELPMVVIMIAFDSSVFDRAVHPLDLTIGPGMLDFGQPVLDAILPAPHIEHVRHVACRWSIGVAGWKGELDAVVGQNGVDFVGNGLDQGGKEGRCRCPASLSDQLHEGEFARAINGDIEIELAFRGLDFGNVDMEVANRIGFELPVVGLVAHHLRQPRDAVPGSGAGKTESDAE